MINFYDEDEFDNEFKQNKTGNSSNDKDLNDENDESKGSNENENQTREMINKVANINELGVVNTPSVIESNIHCITIIGQIEGHMVLPPQNKTTKYEHIIPQLVAAEQNSKIEGLLIILNTVGGDVEAGLAIAEMISTLTKPTVTLVLGGGHSIGVPIAVAGDRTFITETATMTIHPIRMNGLVIGVPQSFEYLDKMQERVTRFITRHSTIHEELFKQLMFKTGELTRDIGTTVIGADAVSYGLINEVGGIGDALKRLRKMIANEKNAERKQQQSDQHQQQREQNTNHEKHQTSSQLAKGRES